MEHGPHDELVPCLRCRIDQRVVDWWEGAYGTLLVELDCGHRQRGIFISWCPN